MEVPNGRAIRNGACFGGLFVAFRGGRVPCLVANVSRAATHRTGRSRIQGLTPLATAHTLHSRAVLPMGGLSEARGSKARCLPRELSPEGTFQW